MRDVWPVAGDNTANLQAAIDRVSSLDGTVLEEHQHRWAGANMVFWNCEGPYLIQKPPAAQNFSFGHIE
jgi:hypothetical protein